MFVDKKKCKKGRDFRAASASKIPDMNETFESMVLFVDIFLIIPKLTFSFWMFLVGQKNHPAVDILI